MASTPIDVETAIASLCTRVVPCEWERVSADEFTRVRGRALARPVQLDRDSPACDVSAMDGYAVRLAELRDSPLSLSGECRIGMEPRELPSRAAARIYTGSPLPQGADTVVRLERGDVSQGRLTLSQDATIDSGADIRRQGENGRRGDLVLSPGVELTPAAVVALASVGATEVDVHRTLRVTVITTGDELVRAGHARALDGALAPWLLRDSNGPAIQAMLASAAWVDMVDSQHGLDSLPALTEMVAHAAATSDAVILTGGVSKGAYDYVPAAIERVGAQTVFHRIAARPGQPTLGAVLHGKPIVGLPGNPLSVLCAGRRLLAPVLRKRGGFSSGSVDGLSVRVSEWAGRPARITWWRPVRLDPLGEATLVHVRGSGDVVGPANSHGFIEVAPGRAEPGLYPFFGWSI